MSQRYFVKTLMNWNKAGNHRRLPWKSEKNPYKIWLSEIILQQTRVEQGLKYYSRFLREFPDILTLARADEKTVFKLWEGLGYYSRCRNLMATAKLIDREYGGIFPSGYDEIRSLKGVGDYTAAAIASFAFKLPYAVVDGNVKRVLSRFFKLDIPIDSGRGKQAVEALAQQLLDKKHPDIYNQAIMDFGATVCRPVNPDCENCPLRKCCKAYQEGLVRLLPVRKKKVKMRTRFFNFIVIRNGGFTYIRHRLDKDIWQKLYEFPLVETTHLLERGEVLDHEALKHWFDSNIFRLDEISSPYSQQLTHQKIFAQFIHVRSDKKLKEVMGAQPMSQGEIARLAFPKIVSDYLKIENK